MTNGKSKTDDSETDDYGVLPLRDSDCTHKGTERIRSP